MIALYRFWPEIRENIQESLRVLPTATPDKATGLALEIKDFTVTLGSYDLAITIPEFKTIEETASAALAIIDATSKKRLYQNGEIFWADIRSGMIPSLITQTPEKPDPFENIPDSVPILVLRAKGGWNVLAAPDRQTWQTLAMTFLNQQTYNLFHYMDDWYEPAINELATLVLGTHQSEDVAGTCQTYNLPGDFLTTWQDEIQPHKKIGENQKKTSSEALANVLQYAALLPNHNQARNETADGLHQLTKLGNNLFRK